MSDERSRLLSKKRLKEFTPEEYVAHVRGLKQEKKKPAKKAKKVKDVPT